MRGLLLVPLVLAASVRAALIPIFAGPVSSQPVSALDKAQIPSFKPYTHYASAAYCSPSKLQDWKCGADCDANKSFKPLVVGGNGSKNQYYFVGYDEHLESVIVAHQGTDVLKIVPVITDISAILVPLDSNLFPGINNAVEVHLGFKNAHATSAVSVLQGVKAALSKYKTNQVTVVGHSLGGAISLLDAVYLQLHLPSSVSVSAVLYGTPRVGNNAFANYVDANLKDLIRVNNKGDPIPDLPPPLGLIPLLSILQFRHPSGEVHILDDGTWVACPGQENIDRRCTAGGTNIVRLALDLVLGLVNVNVLLVAGHSGPYDGVLMGRGC